MALTPGTRIGPYEISAQIGAGGMGEVYRAVDTNLKRAVAIKVLPEVLASDTDRLARLQREAEVLASLNHPNIAQIYGLEKSDPSGSAGQTCAIVMEFVDGETLADRIARRSVPIDEALTIAKQIAGALEAAHEKGVIHRDLKPANIKLTTDDKVKVLDFGLAKLLEGETASTGQSRADLLTNSPTITSPAMPFDFRSGHPEQGRGVTMAGMILGTAAYMSPEQAKGRPADKRSDIWAFGCVLYEMLTGMRPFDPSTLREPQGRPEQGRGATGSGSSRAASRDDGEDIADTLAFVITKAPDWSRLPSATPEPVRRLLRRALEKDRKRRLADIADARVEIDEAQGGSEVAGLASRTSQPLASEMQPARWRSVLPWIVAATTTIGLASALALWAPWRLPPPRAAVRVSAELGVDASLVTDIGTAAVLSPDGQTLAFVAQKEAGMPALLYTRRLDRLQATPMAGSDDAYSASERSRPNPRSGRRTTSPNGASGKGNFGSCGRRSIDGCPS